MTNLSSGFTPVVIMQINDCKQEAPTKPVQELLDSIREQEFDVKRLLKKSRMFSIRHEDEIKLIALRDELRKNPLVIEAHSNNQYPSNIPATVAKKQNNQS